ncbi:MAG: SDR family oxidoreductase [Verrucomicrobiae bacterium]|nr:SDR family oxidoreductase [Verrucomicrobiae bacterium]
MKRSDQKVVLISGAGRGLGAALAAHFAEGDWRVVGQYHRSRPRLAAPHFAVKADLSREAGARKVVTETVRRFGRIDVLINNSGVYHPKGIDRLTEGEWMEGLQTTVSATFFLTRAALPHLRKTRGRVVNIGDSSCERLGKRDLSLSYHVGKTGVLLATRAFAHAEARRRVTVNMVSPGMLENSVGKPPASRMPMGRFGQFADVIGAVDYLLSPGAEYVTGSNLIVGGGWNL